MNEVHLGKAVSNKFKVTDPCAKHVDPRPREEWIIVPGTHEPLVSEADFKKAQLILPKRRYYDAPEHIFGNKVKCPSCGHAMVRYTRQNPRFKCGTAKVSDHYGCREHTVLQSDLERIVLASVKAYAAALADREELKLIVLQQGESEKAGISDRLRTEENAVRLLEESIARNFTLLVSGKLTKDAFVSKKDAINSVIARKNAGLEKLRERLRELTAGKDEAEERLAELRPMLTIEKVDRALVDVMIDKILVYGEREIEIVWAGRFA
jgi:hypothetical protein